MDQLGRGECRPGVSLLTFEHFQRYDGHDVCVHVISPNYA